MLNNIRGSEWYDEVFFTYEKLEEYLRNFQDDENEHWVFRGQPGDKELETTLERECKKSRINLREADIIEKMIIREFRRTYNGVDSFDVTHDTLYCMSLLRHYGAPSRLLDFTYSKYIALYFALKEAYDSIDVETNKEMIRFNIWCIDAKEMNEKARKCYSENPFFISAFNDRANIYTRTDKSFRFLYMENRHNLVISENPARIHMRLHIQQGVQLCPGNVREPFMYHLHSIFGSEYTKKVKKLICTIRVSELKKELEKLRSMNISEESLFPGLDGQARSNKYIMEYLVKLGKHINEEGGKL